MLDSSLLLDVRLRELGVHFYGFLHGESLVCSISDLSSTQKYTFKRIRRPHPLISVMSSVLFTLVGVGTYLRPLLNMLTSCSDNSRSERLITVLRLLLLLTRGLMSRLLRR